MNNINKEKNELGTGLNEGQLESEERMLERMEIPKAGKIAVETTTELLVIILCTIISTILSLLDALNIGPFETSNSSVDFLVIFLAIPLILILFLNHYFKQIISVFLLTYSSVIIYKYLLAKDDIEPLIIIGVLSLFVYLCVGLSLKSITRLRNIFRSFVNKRYRLVGSFVLAFVVIVSIYYYFTSKPLQAEIKRFVNRKIEKAKCWIISNHIKRIEKIKFKNFTGGMIQRRSNLKRIPDTSGIEKWFYGDKYLRYKNSIYVYLVIRDNGTPVFRLVLNYVGRSKNIKFYSIKTKKGIFDISPGEVRSSNVFVWFVETYDCEISTKEIEIIKNILNSNHAVLKYNGQGFSLLHQVSSEERKNLSGMLNFYQYLKYLFCFGFIIQGV